VSGRRTTPSPEKPQSSPPSPGRPGSARNAIAACSALCLAAALCSACGKKGPPLPPLVKVPVPPPEFFAERRGNTVDLRFVVPATNTDGSRPANVAAAEVYAITASPAPAPPQYTDAQLLKYGTRVATVPVKAPRNPDLTADPDEPADEVESPEGSGLDQGATARVSEPLTAATLAPVTVPRDPRAPPQPGQPPPPAATDTGPLLGPSPLPVSRTYAVVGVSTRGRHGPVSKRVVVPLVPPPPPPAAPEVAYTDTAITITWPPIGVPVAPEKTDGDVLPSRPIGTTAPEIAYLVYDVTDPDAATKLTVTPLSDATYEDKRIAWGVKRCYAVRAAETVAGTLIEGDASPATCETLVDTFAPAAPKGLAAIPSDGAINLIWEPNGESDLVGYVVLRARAPSEALEPIMQSPIQETSFRDAVQPGVTFVYAVKAVDRAGNESPASAHVTETAR
jgi:hypothetical protein